MIGHPLRIEYQKSIPAQSSNQINQRDLACIAITTKHAFTGKQPAQCNAIQSADQHAVTPCLDAVCIPPGMELALDVDKVVTNPARRRIGARLGTCTHNLAKCRIAGGGVFAGPDRPR